MRTGECLCLFIKQLCNNPTNYGGVPPQCCSGLGSSLAEIFTARYFFVYFVPRSFSSTESLRQLSEQLNGLVSQVWPRFDPLVLLILSMIDVEL